MAMVPHFLHNECFGLFLKGWKERICLRDKVMQYFVDIHKHIAPVLQVLQPADVLRNVYAVLGYLVKHCAQVLFVQVHCSFSQNFFKNL